MPAPAPDDEKARLARKQKVFRACMLGLMAGSGVFLVSIAETTSPGVGLIFNADTGVPDGPLLACLGAHRHPGLSRRRHRRRWAGDRGDRAHASANRLALASLLTFGGPAGSTQTVAFSTYLSGFQDFRISYASALSYVIVVGVFILTLIFQKVSRFREGEEA